MRAIDVVRRLAPRARPAYVRAFEAGDKLLADYGVTTPLRLAHFLAQIMHETGGLTIERESGAYSASRIMEIFGVGRHSAAVTWAEAKALAGNGPALFERVYGLGNPKKARELGNTRPGDGWKGRGIGMMQSTGFGAFRRLGQKLGLGDLFYDNPDLILDPRYALLPGLAEWKEIGGNALADKNDIASITKRINGGYNGFADRKAWFAKIYPLVSNGIAWTDAEPDPDMREVQELLNAVGYGLAADGRKGPATTKAIEDFQAKNGLKVDGIAGRQTRDKLKARIAGDKAADDPSLVKPLPPGGAASSGSVQGAGAAIAGGAATVAVAVDAAKEVGDVASDARAQWAAGDVIGIVLGIVILAGGLFLLWNRYREAGKLPRWLGGAS